MLQGMRVEWKETGVFGTIKWVTNRGTYAVDWDDGQYNEYNIDMSTAIKIIE